MLEPLKASERERAELARFDEGGGSEVVAGGGKLIRNCSYWFGSDGWAISEWEVLPEADLAVGRIDGFAAEQIAGYPEFRIGGLRPGVSLCRLGFPFHTVAASYDEATDRFRLAPETLPIPRFPNEGILTRLQVAADSQAPFPVTFIETSSPGLRGQSGGPIFDTEGHVWGIQSHTAHISLGFDPVLEIEGRRVTEHQFMNVGVAASSETVVAFLAHVGVDAATTTG